MAPGSVYSHLLLFSHLWAPSQPPWPPLLSLDYAKHLASGTLHALSPLRGMPFAEIPSWSISPCVQDSVQRPPKQGPSLIILFKIDPSVTLHPLNRHCFSSRNSSPHAYLTFLFIVWFPCQIVAMQDERLFCSLVPRTESGKQEIVCKISVERMSECICGAG